MLLLYSLKSPIDLYFFVKSLKDAFIKVGHSSFDLYAQNYIVEVLEIVLEELTSSSVVISAAHNIKIFSSIIYHTCYQVNGTEYILPVLRLPVLKDFPTSLTKVLERESLIGSKTLYCNV